MRLRHIKAFRVISSDSEQQEHHVISESIYSHPNTVKWNKMLMHLQLKAHI
jgi:hypothetical protein